MILLALVALAGPYVVDIETAYLMVAEAVAETSMIYFWIGYRFVKGW